MPDQTEKMEKVVSSEDLLEVVRDTIEAVQYCFLITLGDSGLANARLVQHFLTPKQI